MASRRQHDVEDMQLKFELAQNISDQFNNKTEYDDYINQKTGQLDLNRLSSALSASIWGLVMAKARATFELKDIIDHNHIKAKYNKMFYMTLMIIFAQMLKYSADHNLLESIADTSETKFEAYLFGNYRNGGA